jgi:tetratricopeptide (TPR) repeat protein
MPRNKSLRSFIVVTSLFPLVASAQSAAPSDRSGKLIPPRTREENSGQSLFNLGDKTRRQSRKGADFSKTDALPVIVEAPPKILAAYLGQTLVLQAKIKENTGTREKTNITWILNGKVICNDRACEIPLDGKTGEAGTSTLFVIAYNSYGSDVTKHTLRIVRSAWNPAMPFSNRHKRTEKSEPANTFHSEADSDLPNVYAMRGNAVWAHPDHLMLVGGVGRNVDWRGRLKSGTFGSIKLVEKDVGEWFFLEKSGVTFQRSKEGEPNRSLKLDEGAVRVRSTKAKGSMSATRDYSENIRVVTDDLTVIPERGTDFFLWKKTPTPAKLRARKKRGANEPIPQDELTTLHFVVISGSLSVQLKVPAGEKARNFSVPPGIELVVLENGNVLPPHKPNPTEMEKLLSSTISPEELAEKAKEIADKAAQSKAIDLNEHMKKVEEYAEREDYFEMVNLLSEVEARSSEDVRISYYLGVANRGLYQISKAEKHLQDATKQDEKFSKAPWQLAQMKMEDKKWDEALEFLNVAEARMEAKDPLASEYYYYSGVANFNASNDFSARNHFMLALWQNDLDAALKQSSGSFLQNLSKKKPWSLVALMGVQYDSNALSLPNGTTLPEGYSAKGVSRFLGGGVFSYDPGTAAQDAAWYMGYDAKAIVLKNLAKAFSQFDAYVLEFGISQTHKYKGTPLPAEPGTEKKEPEIQGYKLSESVELTLLNGKMVKQALKLSFKKAPLELTAAYERDPVNTGEANKNAIGLGQSRPFSLVANDAYSVDLGVDASQKYYLKKSDANAPTFGLTLTPALTVPFSVRTTTRLAIAVGDDIAFKSPMSSTYKFAPSLSGTHFLTPWLIGILSANYDLTYETPTKNMISKPGASLILTGLF